MDGPTLGGYINFLRTIANLNETVLPDGSPIIEFSYNFSINTCNPLLALIPQIPGEFLYITAVYNLAVDTLLTYAQDQPGQTVFADIQQKYQLHTLVAGVVESASDESTSSSLKVPDFWSGMTIGNLQNLKTPYGRMYLQIAQDFGSMSLAVMA